MEGPNQETSEACLTPNGNVCYRRWPTESYAGYPAFQAAYKAPGDSGWHETSWWTPSIFIQHMSASRYDVADYNTHGLEGDSLITTDAAKSITKAGLIVTLAGCNVAGLAQPFSLSGVDNPDVSASDNLLLGYLYGASSALAALGASQQRTMAAQYPVMFDALKTGRQYLGKAHHARMKARYAVAGADPRCAPTTRHAARVRASAIPQHPGQPDRSEGLPRDSGIVWRSARHRFGACVSPVAAPVAWQPQRCLSAVAVPFLRNPTTRTVGGSGSTP